MDSDTKHINALAARAASGDEEAKTELVSLLWDQSLEHVRALIKSYRLNVDATEIIGELWEDTLHNLHKFNTSDFRWWAAKRRNWRLQDLVRKNKRISKTEHSQAELPDASVPSDSNSLHSLENRMLAKQVLEYIDSLPERPRVVLKRCCINGWSYAKVAKLLNIKTGTVDKIRTRAIADLKKKFGPNILLE